jgi:hypothetical protein
MQANWARVAVVGQTGVLRSQSAQRLSNQSRSITLLPPASLAVGAGRRLASAGVLTTRRCVLPKMPTTAHNTDPGIRGMSYSFARKGQEPGSRGIAHEARR